MNTLFRTMVAGIFLLISFSAISFENNKEVFSDESFNVPFKLKHFSLPLNQYIRFLAGESGYEYIHLDNECLDKEQAESGLKHNAYTNMVGSRFLYLSQIHKDTAKFQVDLKKKKISLICINTSEE
jgi:hypothetical protein